MDSILISGAGGFLGRSISGALSKQGFRIFSLSTSATGPNIIHWNPLKGAAPVELPQVEIVINLAGESLAKIPWTAARRKKIRDSRELGTKMLIECLAAEGVRPRLFLSASAVGYYGETADRLVREEDAKGSGFLADVCDAWENEAGKASSVLGCRTAMMRLGVVIGKDGGMMKTLLPLFRCGLGGKLGSGNQYMSWISIDDVVRAIELVIGDDRLKGPINFVAPNSVTNSEFTNTLADSISRPAFFSAPEFILRTILGEFADEMLLSSTRASPEKLQSVGFEFTFPELKQAVSRCI